MEGDHLVGLIDVVHLRNINQAQLWWLQDVKPTEVAAFSNAPPPPFSTCDGQRGGSEADNLLISINNCGESDFVPCRAPWDCEQGS